MRIFFLFLVFLTSPVSALDAADLAGRIVHAGDLEPLFKTLDTNELAADAGGGAGLAGALEAVRDKVESGGIIGAAFATDAAGQTLRLNFANGGINYLTLDVDDGGRLAGWYDYALGVHLHELVGALAGEGTDEAGDLLARLGAAPGEVIEDVPADSPLARLVLAACSGLPCYTGVLSRQRPMNPVRASLWRYEQAVLLERSGEAARAMKALQQELGENAGLAWLEAATLMRDGDPGAALARAEKALERDPDYRPLYGLAAQCAVMVGDHERATHWFRRLQERFGQRIDWQALRHQPRWRDYLESGSFRRWQAE